MHHVPLPPITCVCLFDGEKQHRFLFYGVPKPEWQANARALLALMDEAKVLAGFNAILFDLPYIARIFDAEVHPQLRFR